MTGVRVVTDSASDLSTALAAEIGVTVVPLTIRFGTEEFVDQRDLTPEEFWRRCKASPVLPETAAPSPGAFQEAFSAATDAGDEVLCITISSKLSATFQSAQAAADALGGGAAVRVIDSDSVTMGQGLLAIAAAESARDGATLDTLVTDTLDRITRTRVYGVVDTLEHLQKGGRIGGAAALLGSLLSIKPVIQVNDGVVEQESRQRTRNRSLDYLAAKVLADQPLDRLAVCSGAAPDLDLLLAKLAHVEVAHPMLTADLGPVVGTHAGPGTVGVCYQVAAGST
jgi:DegV family protein with EDD domain